VFALQRLRPQINSCHRKLSSCRGIGFFGKADEKIGRAEDFFSRAEEKIGKAKEKISRGNVSPGLKNHFSGLFFLSSGKAEDFSGKAEEKIRKNLRQDSLRFEAHNPVLRAFLWATLPRFRGKMRRGCGAVKV